jgi:hypothetical protein
MHTNEVTSRPRNVLLYFNKFKFSNNLPLAPTFANLKTDTTKVKKLPISVNIISCNLTNFEFQFFKFSMIKNKHIPVELLYEIMLRMLKSSSPKLGISLEKGIIVTKTKIKCLIRNQKR